MKQYTIAVLGGDQRMDFAARELARRGLTVREWGRRKSDDAAAFAKDAPKWFLDVDALMLPLPTSIDGTHLSTPLLDSSEGLRMETLFCAAPNKRWFVGRLSDSLLLRAEREGIHPTDYFHSELLQLKNALPTAEGAIEIAMRELPVVLTDTRVAVVGYGRIGELLAAKLNALGAKVTVYARREISCVRAELAGSRAVQISSLPENENTLCFDTETRVIFNTVPSWLLTRSVLQKLTLECLIIDLASAPGGVDRIAAEELGIRSIWATALPGKCAPESAGIILGQTVYSILTETT